jgi:hypothetical protein
MASPMHLLYRSALARRMGRIVRDPSNEFERDSNVISGDEISQSS